MRSMPRGILLPGRNHHSGDVSGRVLLFSQHDLRDGASLPSGNLQHRAWAGSGCRLYRMCVLSAACVLLSSVSHNLLRCGRFILCIFWTDGTRRTLRAGALLPVGRIYTRARRKRFNRWTVQRRLRLSSRGLLVDTERPRQEWLSMPERIILSDRVVTRKRLCTGDVSAQSGPVLLPFLPSRLHLCWQHELARNLSDRQVVFFPCYHLVKQDAP